MALIRQHLGGRFWIEVDASTVKEAFKGLQPFQEVFSDKACGKCGSPEIVTDHRKDKKDGFDYFSMKCTACRAQLDYGQHKIGETLYPKRKLPSGEYDSSFHGWFNYQDRQATESKQDSPQGQGPPPEQGQWQGQETPPEGPSF